MDGPHGSAACANEKGGTRFRRRGEIEKSPVALSLALELEHFDATALLLDLRFEAIDLAFEGTKDARDFILVPDGHGVIDLETHILFRILHAILNVGDLGLQLGFFGGNFELRI